MLKIEYHKNKNGKSQIIEWLESLPITFQTRIEKRIKRLEYKHYGEYEEIKKGNGLIELKFYFGSGFRIYLIKQNKKIILLYGGDKRTQKKDIEKAKEYITEYKQRGDKWKTEISILICTED